MELQKLTCGYSYEVKPKGEEKKQVICKSKLSANTKWCGKHARGGIVLEDREKGIRHCNNWRGCPNSILPDGYLFNTCESCRQKANGRSTNLKANIRILQKTQLAEAKDGDLVICQQCHNDKLKKGFMTLKGKQSTKCFDCYQIQAKIQAERWQD
jgi:hypothetical protein